MIEGNSFLSLSSNSPIKSRESSLNAKNLAHCSTVSARCLLHYDAAKQYGALPLGLIRTNGHEVLTIAIGERADFTLLKTLRFLTEREVQTISVDRETLLQAIYLAYEGEETRLVDGVRELQAYKATSLSKPQEVPTLSSSAEVPKFLETLIHYAISRDCSDIHLLPRRDGGYIKLRISGELHQHSSPLCDLSTYHEIIRRIKVLAALDTTGKILPQDGQFEIQTPGKPCYVRVSIMPTIHGEKAVLRLHGITGVKEMHTLGFDSFTYEALLRAVNTSHGLILFSGPTGSGKSSSMYSLLSLLGGGQKNIISVEDPVEYRLEGVSQTSLSERHGMTYATALRAMLRQDPDVLLLGEIRDSESAMVAVQAAFTSHLILSTIHARNAYEVLLRLSHLGVDALTLAQGLSLIVSQRLIPRLCRNCRIIDLHYSKREGRELYKAAGCAECDYAGIQGRILASESVVISSDLRSALYKGIPSFESFSTFARPYSSSSLKDHLYSHLEDGLISYESFVQFG